MDHSHEYNQFGIQNSAISIEFNDVISNNLAGYEESNRVLYMIRQLFSSSFQSFTECFVIKRGIKKWSVLGIFWFSEYDNECSD